MPNRMFSDRAWISDKLRAVEPDEFRAEYAWIYSLAESDGTFECDAHKVWARCYAPCRQIGPAHGRGRHHDAAMRSAWTPEKVQQLLDELVMKGLLLRIIDGDGKAWGYWVGSEPLLPQLSHRAKFKKGKKFLFNVDSNGMPLASQQHDQGYRGLGSGLGLGLGIGDGAPPAAVQSPTIASVMESLEAERDTTERNGIEQGQPGFFRRGQYPGTSPKDVWRHCAHKWANMRGDGAYCPMPTKFKDGNDPWKNLCEVTSGDLIVPAFELWTMKEGKFFKTLPYPLGEFMKQNNYQKYLAMVSPLNEVTPKISDAEITAAKARAKQAHIEQWGLNPDGSVPKSEEEPGADQF